jgi:DHA1 family tetracycline resistance protein-like MFS transporter
VLGQGLAVRRVVARLGEMRTLVLGLAFATGGHLLFGLAGSGPAMVAGILVVGLGGLANPAIHAMVAGEVLPSEQGGVQGAIASILELTSIAGPLMASQLLAAFTGRGAPFELPGAPWFASAACLVGALAVVLRAVPRREG